MAKAARRCGPGPLAGLRRQLERVAAPLEDVSGAAVRREAAAVLARRRRRARRALASLHEVAQVADRDAAKVLHRARLRVKAWRYAEELAGADRAARSAADLKALQERLGAIHDRYVLRARAVARGGLDPLVSAIDGEIQRDWDGLRAGVPLTARRAAVGAVGARKATMRAGAAWRRDAGLGDRSAAASGSTRTRTPSIDSSRSTRRRAAQSSSPAPRRAATRSDATRTSSSTNSARCWSTARWMTMPASGC